MQCKVEMALQNLSRPIVLHPQWMKIPEILKKEIERQRAVQVLKSEYGEATDAEALAYLYSASLAAPLRSEYVNIYLYLYQKIMKQIGIQLPPELCEVKSLSDYEKQLLADLKQWIWKKSMRTAKKKGKQK